MTPDVTEAIKQIDDALAGYQQVEAKFRKVGRHRDGIPYDYIDAPEEIEAEVLALLGATLKRLHPEGEQAVRDVLVVIHDQRGFESEKMRKMVGALRALKADFQAGRLRRFGEMVRSHLFSDFLEMAEYLLNDEGLKDPAAVLAGGVLEQHLRKLCDKQDILTTFTDAKGNVKPKKLDTMSAELAKAGVYGGNDQKQVTAWAGIRNAAAHAEYQKYTAEQVRLMAQGIRDFMARNPA